MNSREFKKRLDEEFDFMVTPLVFNLRMYFKSQAFDIEAVYGSGTFHSLMMFLYPKDSEKSSNTLMHIHTLFPSSKKEGKSKGGIVLLKLKKKERAEDSDIEIGVEWKDRKGEKDSEVAKINVEDKSEKLESKDEQEQEQENLGFFFFLQCCLISSRNSQGDCINSLCNFDAVIIWLWRTYNIRY